MQGYGASFAQVYNRLWSGFARDTAPHIFDYYASTELASVHQSLLDLCCGTGQLSLYFLERGYRVTGLDLSDAMLDHARANAAMFVGAGQAKFMRGDVSNYSLDESFGLVVSTFDALNHLPDLDALHRTFVCTADVTLPQGRFVFDLNTRVGLRRWNNIVVDETDDALVINRGVYDGGDRAYTRVSGFVREGGEGDCYQRFDEMVYNTVFDLAAVRAALLDTGWHDIYFAHPRDLAAPVDDPESHGRIFIVATR